MSSELTVAQAAKCLHISEHHLNNLLNAGYIAFRQENGERLVQQDSMLDFEQERERKHAAVNRMIRLNQEMGLYDD
jgi:phage antirepressor YoqD-like protein